MSDQHEHKWSIASRNGYEAKFRCKFWNCSETLTPEQTEVMLNEHAALKRENEALLSYKNEVDDVCDVMFQFTMQRLQKEKEDALLTAEEQFTGGTTPAYFSAQNKEEPE